MKSLNGVWIGAIVISIATIAFVEFVRDGATEQASTGQQAATARNASIATPSNQQGDPYERNRALAVSAVRNAYFAAGCKIFTSDEEVLPLVAQELGALKEEAEAHGTTDVKLQEELNAAGQDGAAQAQRPGACDYWQEHPDAVSAVRRAIREAAEP
jgi:hypothetical protein